MNPFSIQTLTGSQIDQAVLLLESQMREHDIVTDRAGIRDVLHLMLQEPRAGFVLVAVAGHNVLGIACVSAIVSMEYGGISGWLEELYVLPDWRGRGIGSQLLSGVLERAKTLGWKAVDLEVEAGHQRAAVLYERHGFKPHTRSRYYNSLGAPDPFHP